MHAIRNIALVAALSALVGCQKKEEAKPEAATKAPLKIAYSDWPGWTAFEIAKQKGWFKEAGVDVEFSWFEYAPSMEAFTAGKVDAVTIASCDALVTGAGAQGGKNVAILVTDYSNGNDMIVAKPGISSLKELKGKKVGIEIGFVEHLLLSKGLQKLGMKETDVTLVGTPTNQTAQVLATGDVSAIGAWQPNSGQALKSVPGSKAIYTSADEPGLIYDFLSVSPQSLAERRDDWVKVVKVWDRVVKYLADSTTRKDGIAIMAARVGVKPEEYAAFLDGTKFLTLAESRPRFQPGGDLKSIPYSMSVADTFNVANKVYKESLKVSGFLDSTLTVDALK
jgi:NitT/TauT family transport system substrate-binding protein